MQSILGAAFLAFSVSMGWLATPATDPTDPPPSCYGCGASKIVSATLFNAPVPAANYITLSFPTDRAGVCGCLDENGDEEHAPVACHQISACRASGSFSLVNPNLFTMYAWKDDANPFPPQTMPLEADNLYIAPHGTCGKTNHFEFVFWMIGGGALEVKITTVCDDCGGVCPAEVEGG